MQYVVDEVHEFLQAGRVGLYEFVEMQRDDVDRSPEVEAVRRGVARAALRQLLAEPEIRLVWFVWAQPGPVPGPEMAGEDDAHWETPGEGPYPAVIWAADL